MADHDSQIDKLQSTLSEQKSKVSGEYKDAIDVQDTYIFGDKVNYFQSLKSKLVLQEPAALKHYEKGAQEVSQMLEQLVQAGMALVEKKDAG
jgi:hypothetical protein